MTFRKALFPVLVLLVLSGCYIGSSEPLVTRNDALQALPDHNEGEFTDRDGDVVRVRIARERNSNDYIMSSPDDPDDVPWTLRFFDIGSSALFGVQVTIPNGGVAYSLVGTSDEGTIQIDIYSFGINSEWLERAGVSFRGSDSMGIMLQSRRDLMRMMARVVAEETYSRANTIRTWPGGFSNPQARGVIRSGDYRAGELLAAIHDGRTDDVSAYYISPYLLEFATVFNNIERDRACLDLFTQRVRTQLPIMASARAAEIIFGGILDTHQNNGGGRERALAEGLAGGAEIVGNMAALTLSARTDAALFYSRHGCSSRTSARFFRNFNAFVTSSG